MRLPLPQLFLIAVILAQAVPAPAQTLGNPFGNPSKPTADDKTINNNDDTLEGERTNYCKTKTEICFVPNGGYADNPCGCTTNGQYEKGRFVKKDQLH